MEFKAKLAEWTPAIKAALAAQGPKAADVGKLLAQATALSKPGGDMPQALEKLSECHKLATAAAPPKAGGDDPAVEFKAKLAEWTPAIKAALAAQGPKAADVGKLLAQATALSKPGGDMPQALAKLAECHALATTAAPPKAAGTEPPKASDKLSLVALAKSRFAWRAERTNAVAEIGRLQAALRARFKDVNSLQQALSAAQDRLGKLIAKFGPELDDALDRVLNGDEAARPDLIQQVRALMKGFLETIDRDEIMAVLDGNEVLPDMSVTEPMRRRLGDISAALGDIPA